MKHLLMLFAMLVAIAIQLSAQFNLIPTPNVVQQSDGKFIFNDQTVIVCTNELLKQEAIILRTYLQPAMGFRLNIETAELKSSIILAFANKQDSISSEGYQLKVSDHTIEIRAVDSGGFFNAFQTLLQLLPPDIYCTEKADKIRWVIKGVFIKDQPKFSWRGVMLDVSRQFYELAYLKKYINWMSAHKLNVFHLHLTDDDGWRIEIKSLPKLTEIGAWRGPNELLPPSHGSGNKRYGGFYTQEELKELVKYAEQRNVQILPEIDIPGHSKSVAVAYPQILCNGNDTTVSVQGVKNNVWCAAKEENYEMFDKIIAEVAAIFPFEYIHVGGDEVNHKAWENCTLCNDLMEKNNYSKSSQLQNYVISRAENIIRKHGKKMIGWNEILENDMLNPETAIMSWTSAEAGLKAFQTHHQVILSPSSYLYLDMAQGNGERGHNWATFLPAERLFSFQIPNDSLSMAYTMGIQANLWSEFLDQPDFQTEYQSYPRICALAELAWAGNKIKYKEFEKKIESAHYDRMYNMRIHFRVPPPIVKHDKNKIWIENGLKNSTVYYTTDSSLPTKSSNIFFKTLTYDNKTENTDKFRFRSCYRDSLFSPAVSFGYDTFCTWSKELLSAGKSDTLQLFGTIKSTLSKRSKSLLFSYQYGADEIEIKQISIYQNNTLIFEKRNEKPIKLFTRNCEWQVVLPENTLCDKGRYNIKITLTNKPKDSNGSIYIIQE